MVMFEELWQRASEERPPNPNGFTGKLISGLAEALDVDQVEYAELHDAALFLLDLSPLHLKGMDLNVIMVAQVPLTDEDARLQADSLTMQRYALQREGMCFEIRFGKEPQNLNQHARADLKVISLTYSDLARLFKSRSPVFVLFEIIRRQVPLTQLCPYDTTREAHGAMFFGRTKELDQLVEAVNTSFLVAGARRVGKTSLLKRAYNLLRTKATRGNRTQAFYLNCLTWANARDGFRWIAHCIDPKSEQRIDKSSRNILYLLERRSQRGSDPLFLFFDEIDRIVDIDCGAGWQLFRVLREAVTHGWIRPVFAGYSSAWDLNSLGSPFYEALQPLHLDALSKREMEDLVVKPFSSVGISLTNERIILDRIWTGSAGQPYLVQFYGRQLFDCASSRLPPSFSIADVESIERGNDIRNYVLDHFLTNTLPLTQAVPPERICAYLYAHKANGTAWSIQDFITAAKRTKVRLSTKNAFHATESLRMANIFSCAGGRYSFAMPIMREVLCDAFPKLHLAVRTP
jgi:AAA domain